MPRNPILGSLMNYVAPPTSDVRRLLQSPGRESLYSDKSLAILHLIRSNLISLKALTEENQTGGQG
jgi:hypothetical protein